MRGIRKFQVVRDPEAADFNAVRVTIFSYEETVCGWYITPVFYEGPQHYLPMSERLPAALAVVRALGLADMLGLKLCIIDPDALWSQVWPPT